MSGLSRSLKAAGSPPLRLTVTINHALCDRSLAGGRRPRSHTYHDVLAATEYLHVLYGPEGLECPLLAAGSTGRRNTLRLEGEDGASDETSRVLSRLTAAEKPALWDRWQCAQELGIQTPAERMR